MTLSLLLPVFLCGYCTLYIIFVNTVDCLRTDKTIPRKKYWRISKARQTVEDTKRFSSEVGVLKLSDGGLSQPKTPSVSLEMCVMKISDGVMPSPKNHLCLLKWVS